MNIWFRLGRWVLDISLVHHQRVEEPEDGTVTLVKYPVTEPSEWSN